MANFDWRARLREGVVIPAHPLALTKNRTLDEARQASLTRYYLDAGAGGVAVGVHTTQFAIREKGLYQPVLALAADGSLWLWPDRGYYNYTSLLKLPKQPEFLGNVLDTSN